MLWIILLVSCLPAAAVVWIARERSPKGAEWKPYLMRVGILTGIGLFAAGPFLTTKSLGTSEAYNYSLAVADAVTQFRAGVFPALVGQSEFAFNGRIHPLRTAPYLTYFAGLLDLASFRQLNFWALQNLALALSLMAGAFSAYVSLRRCTQVSTSAALTLVAAYVLSPGSLGAAYAMDLYMTVMAIPYIPLVVAGNLRALDGRRTFGSYLGLAVALGLCWWAHPPVALWLSLATATCHLPLLFSGRIRWAEIKALIPATLTGLALAGFVFVSALTVRTYGSMAAARAPEAVVKEVVQAFSASLKPISPAANLLGDFQLGYALWCLLFLGMAGAIAKRVFSATILLGCALFLLAFTVPIPGLTAWLWGHMPTFAITMNGPWPMQRLYLVVAAFTVFGVARVGVSGGLERVPKFARDFATLVLAVLTVWSAYQAFGFIGRGYASRTDAAYTRYSHYTENINPTLIAYAMFTLPPHFANGVMDPVMETRVLKRETAAELLSNWTAPSAWGREVQKGTLSASGNSPASDIAELNPRLKLEPGLKYRLELNFRSPPVKGALRLIGANTIRVYPLPQAGEARGFGMLPANNHVLTLWTSAKETEFVSVQLIGPGLGSARLLNFADFTLRVYDPAKLPIRVESWVPFTATVLSPEPGYLEIPRIFLDGYAATVNGQTVRAQKSPDGLVMAAIPAGECRIQISYPGIPPLRASFWISLAVAAILAATALVLFMLPSAKAILSDSANAAAQVFWRRKWQIAGAVLTVAVVLAGLRTWQSYRNAVGPILLRVVLPRGEIGRSQPLLTSGEPQQGAFVFAIYTDINHVQLGVDVWGKGFAKISDPVQVDYFAEHEIVISTGTLYPASHPKTKGLDSARLEQLRNRVTLQLDGKTVLDEPVFTFDSPRRSITIGENRIQGSSTEPKFVGKILEIERLPIR